MTVPAYIVIPDVAGPLAEATFASCPIADARAPWVESVVRAYRLTQSAGVSLTDLYREPTLAAVDALDAFAGAVRDVRAADREERDARRDAEHAARSSRRA